MSALKLHTEDITFVTTPLDKELAIEFVAQKMIDAGLVTESYTQAMFDRERQTSTFLGNGIAIPHGTADQRNNVLQTGLKVLYCSHGVTWDDEDNIAYVMVGIAATSNDHIDILRQLTRAVIAEDTLQKIKQVKTEQELLAILIGE